MLRPLIDLIRKSRCEALEGTLFCTNVTVDSEVKILIGSLQEENILENSDFENATGSIVNLELSLPRLSPIGYYQDKVTFVRKNHYRYPETLFYIADLDRLSDEDDVVFYIQYRSLINFLNAIKAISRHSYTDIDIEYSLVFRDDRSLILPLIYGLKQIELLSPEHINDIALIVEVYSAPTSEKKLLYINELIDYLVPVYEGLRFKTLLENVSEFASKCANAHQYYLRDFSSNKLKLELDSKALEFSQKIQSVINDSQTKLIAIPTAFVLVFSAFDFNDLNSTKDVVSIISLFIFAVIIQIFLANQNSSLNFTHANILSYRNTFSKNNITEFEQKFALVDEELNKQKARLCIVTWLLWLIPAMLFIIWFVLILVHSKVPAIHGQMPPKNP